MTVAARVEAPVASSDPAEYVIDFPTLFVALDWAQEHCVIPDGFRKGEPFEFADWQAWCLLNFYRVKLSATVGQLAPAFFYRRGQIVKPQKAGKAPYTSAHVCVEAVGPALFAGWAQGGEVWDCRDHRCPCGWVYEYEPGEPMGQPWPTPLIQITAFSEDQTDNIYSALRPMIENGPLADLIPKTGEEFIRLPNDGRIDIVTSNAQSRLGARVTFVPQDETGIWTKRNGMVNVAQTQRRGLAGMGGRAEETTNGWDPNEGSVAQLTADAKTKDVFRLHPLAPKHLKYGNARDRAQIHRYVYKGCPWVPLDSIEGEAAELIETDPGQAERFFGNRIVAGADKAFDLDIFRALGPTDDRGTVVRPEVLLPVEPGRLVTSGFDGSLSDDETVLTVTDVERMHTVPIARWRRPPEFRDDDSWRVPLDELDEAVEFVFDTWNVWRLLGDPPRYRDDMNRWAGRYGSDRVVEWWTSDRKKTALALREYRANMQPGRMSHGPLVLAAGDAPSAEALERHAAFVEHHGNAVKKPTNMRDDESGAFLWLVGKEAPKSAKKIDFTIGGCLSFTAAGHARRAGALEQESYGRAQWSGGQSSGRGAAGAPREPCIGCGKPISAKLHEPGAPERGRCMKCRAKAGGVGRANW